MTQTIVPGSILIKGVNPADLGSLTVEALIQRGDAELLVSDASVEKRLDLIIDLLQETVVALQMIAADSRGGYQRPQANLTPTSERILISHAD